METMKREIDNTPVGSIYESNEEIPQYPPRTTLYSLEPHKLGTAMVGSLSGYVADLADEHSTRVGDLVGRVLSGIDNPHGNVLPPRNLRRTTTTSHHGFTQFDYAINGTTGVAERMVFALEALTGRRDLRGLTFLGYKPVLGAFHFHKNRRWCPQCLAEWQTSHQRLYEPLLWTCATTFTCPIHRCPLDRNCPKCCRTVGPITVGACIGYCDHCSAWLGQAGRPDKSSNVEIDKEALWKQEQVICLIQHISDVQPLASTSKWPSKLRSLIEATTNGSIWAFAKHVRLDIATIESWLEAKWIPQVDSAMRLSQALGISLWSLVGNSPMSEDELTTARESCAKSNLQFQRRQRETESICAELGRSLSGPAPETLTTISARLGLTNPSRLHSADKKSTLAIVERNRHSRGTSPDRKFDKVRARRILIREIASNDPRSTLELATELEFSTSTLQWHFPQLCKQLVRKRKEEQEKLRAAVVKELTLALEEVPVPCMHELCERLGYCPGTLQRWGPQVCRQIAKRWASSKHANRIRIQTGLRSLLAENPPLLLKEVIHRLGTTPIFVKKHFPELVAKLVERRRSYENEIKQARMDGLIRAISVIVNELEANGEYPTVRKVMSRVPPQFLLAGWPIVGSTILQMIKTHRSEQTIPRST